MNVTFRLKQVLDELGVPEYGRSSGLEKRIKLDRHQVAALLSGQTQRISLKHLGALCAYLIDELHVEPRAVFNRLFALEPSHFLSLLRAQRKVTMCFGVRRDAFDPSHRWSSGADTYLSGALLELLYRPWTSQPAKAEENKPQDDPPPKRRRAKAGSPPDELPTTPKPLRYSAVESFRQELIHAIRGPLDVQHEAKHREAMDAVMRDAEMTDKDVRSDRAGHTAILLGSVKSNGLIELALARKFFSAAWQPHGRRVDPSDAAQPLEPPRKPQDRAVPFFLRYRNEKARMIDPQFPSCHAGLQLCTSKVTCGDNSTIPGIYYEDAHADWQHIASNDEEDAAIVLYDHDRGSGATDVIMGGFSSKATLALADKLEEIADDFWKPCIETPQRWLGAYVIRFRFDPSAQETSQGVHLPATVGKPEVIRLAHGTLARRLEPPQITVTAFPEMRPHPTEDSGR